MKVAEGCLDCLQRQVDQTLSISGYPQEKWHVIQVKIKELLKVCDRDLSVPEIAIDVYSEIARMTGVVDPYLEIKKQSNRQALKILPILREKVSQSDNPMATAARFAVSGNIIDYGAFDHEGIRKAMDRQLDLPLSIDHSEVLLSRLAQISGGGTLLYLLDNCGEIVYDILLLELLYDQGVNITLVVRGGAIINDALLEDIEECGLDKFGRVITSGLSCPGTPLHRCTEELKRLFLESDQIISKGQGNFETLSSVNRSINFLLTIKCEVVAKYIAKAIPANIDLIRGNGEMAVYCK